MTIPAEHTRAGSTADFVSQSTAVEQARAIAEVQAAVVIAHERPRDVDLCRASIRISCEMPKMAERAFYTFPRAGESITGPSVYLAREVARCWGNMQHGTRELRREQGWSEMQAWAWDLETNTREATDFIVLHIRDTKGGAKKLTEQRDIREANQADAARSVREAIFQVVPTWFSDEAQDVCRATLEKDEDPIEVRADKSAETFSQLGVTLGRLEVKLGKPKAQWTVFDVTQLKIAHRAISRGESTIDATFPGNPVTAAEITGGSK